MTDELKQEALAFIEQVEAIATDKGYQTAKNEFDKKVEQLQADFDKRIVQEREKYYNEGYKDCQEAQSDAPVIYPPISLADGEEFSNAKKISVTSFSYSRKFPTNWGTLVLPIALDYSDWSSKFEIAEITGVDVGSSIKAKKKVLGSGSTTIANRPYLIRAKKSSSTAQTITKKNCIVHPSTPETLELVEGGKTYTFKGVYKPMSAEELIGKYYSSNGAFVSAISKCNPMRVILEIS